MHECYAMQILETKKKKINKKKKIKTKQNKNKNKNKNKKTKNKTKQKTKNNGRKGKSNEAQGPRQKDSIRSSFLHPKPFRCTTSIGVCIHIRVISNSKIGIKVERAFTNSPISAIGSCACGTGTFGLFALLAACSL